MHPTSVLHNYPFPEIGLVCANLGYALGFGLGVGFKRAELDSSVTAQKYRRRMALPGSAAFGMTMPNCLRSRTPFWAANTRQQQEVSQVYTPAPL